MERTWGGVRPELSARLRTPGQCLGLWLACGHLDGAWVSGSLTDTWTVPGSLSRFTSKKFLRFLISQELFLTRSPSRPIEALFTAQSSLTRELLTPKFHIDPRTSLLTLPREGAVPLAVGHHKIILYQSLHISHIQWILLRLIS